MNSVNAQSEKNLLPGCQVHHFQFFFSVLHYFSWSKPFSAIFNGKLPISLVFFFSSFFFTPGQ